jgi:hypothetical protein
MEYDLDARVADARERALVMERFIHAEIYRARPDVTGDKKPMYIKPNPDAGGGGGDNAREWEAYQRRAEILMKR